MIGPLELYLRLERIMLDLDRASDPLADHFRDLMDPVWQRLSDREIELLDRRGKVGDAGLFPVQLPPPEAPPPGPPPTVANQRLNGPGTGWQASDDWRVAA
jgi:hypothetical protein